MIRVLVVDDSETARSLLVLILGSDPGLEVVGEARDGVEAVEMTQRLRPDVVTMDILMPRLDGLAATREIMITAPTPIVIVTAGALPGEVEGSLEMLGHGALDVLKKPVGPDAPGFAASARRLISTVKAMSQVKVVRRWREYPPRPRPNPPGPTPPPVAGTPAQIVAIGASTGGPLALQKLLSGLPPDFSAPILAVQHITQGFTEGLARWLDSVCDLRVKVAGDGEILARGTVYLAPDGLHLGVSDRRRLVTSDDPPVGGFRPSATSLFESVARSFGSSALAVILTGMGVDGVQGLAAIRQKGGRVLAQDESTSVVFGMPGAAIDAGLADLVLPIDAIPARIAAMTRARNAP
ncbi:chemotaxis-specific protein-glutamate methyltransferase CheB [Tundrisphaera lichenicola]|uniref:chemotaxis-specific protein-glutamate methyltransferase CheB n=1 Tax=Tundrisphaera lichenicola TaxID=2029860 RepID=UPI003EBA63CF